ncbi:HU family DNA-binding protein [Candidatus Azambacteria bacterium]|nr:HU family DNA-binding protein [Candidatus Azambacteria bacterium]
MNKDSLVESVLSKAGLETKKAAQDAVEAVFSTIEATLAKGEEVAISGFGTFSAKARAARQGVNPKTGAKIQIAATTVPKFKAGKGLKDAVKK